MKILKRNLGKAVPAILAASMLFQATALAAPSDELNEILENQAKLQEESLLGETIGFSEMGEAMAESGLWLQVSLGLNEQTAELLGMYDTIPEGGYITFNTQIDPNLQKWLFDAGIGTDEASILDFSAYGDMERLAITIPQFFNGALSLHSGNLREQYLNSDLAQLIGETGEIPDIDLKFYPEEPDIAGEAAPFAGLREQIEEKAGQIEESMEVEKTEEDGAIVYTAAVATKDAMDIYRMVMNSYVALFTDSELGLFTYGEASTFEAEVDQMVDEIESMMGEDIVVTFTVKDGLVEKIGYEVFIDTTNFVASSYGEETTIAEEVVEEIAEEAGAVENASGPDASETENTEAVSDIEEVATEDGKLPDSDFDVTIEAENFKGYCTYELIYANPKSPLESFELNMLVEAEDGSESAAMNMAKETTVIDSVSETAVTLEMSENGEIIYSGTPINMTFNAETGDLDAAIEITDSETGETVAFRMDSTFEEIDKGKSFLWNIDGLNVEADGQSVGLAAQIRVSADPGEIKAPQTERVLFDLTQQELFVLVTEISAKAESWAAQFEPETEAVDGEILVGEESGASEGAAEITEASEASEGASEISEASGVSEDTAAVIGGADGPTAVFIAGKLG